MIWTAVGVSCILLVATVFIIRFKPKSHILTEMEVQDFFDGDPESTTASADENTEELKVEKVGFPKRFRLPSESYMIGKNTTHGLFIHGGVKASLLLLLQTGA